MESCRKTLEAWVAHGILADPTLLMTKRGLEWLHRTATAQACTIRCSSAYVIAESGGFPSDVDPYWRRGALGGRRQHYYIFSDLADSLAVTASDAAAASLLRLERLKSPDKEVVAEIWSGLVAGDSLIARRACTFEALVQVGATVIIRGPDDYPVALAEATRNLPPSLAAALDRRIRFIATASDQSDQFDRPTLSVYDGGQRSYH
jgi:hypothetical protein